MLSGAWKASEYHSTSKVRWNSTKRVLFFLKIVLNHKDLAKILNNKKDIFAAKFFLERPEYYQIVNSPYLDASWNLKNRVDKLFSHLDVMKDKNLNLFFEFDQSIIVLNLDEVNLPGYRIILDKPIWFHREGVLSLNLFKGDLRLYTVSFSIDQDEGIPKILIGGIQGRNIESALEEYRILTKASHGMRPRDFIIELTRIFGAAIGAEGIEAVSDECRHQRHIYFGKDTQRPLPANYNEIWTDRGGVRIAHNRFVLPMNPDRDLEKVAAKKRSMYRKRYEMLNSIEREVKHNFANLVAVPVIEGTDP